MSCTSAACLSIVSKRYVVATALIIFTLLFLRSESAPSFGKLKSHLDGFVYAGASGGQAESDAPGRNLKDFVDRALENDIYVSKYNGTAVRRLCSEAKWRDDIVMSCDKIAGGIGNLDTEILACARYAIEAGAMLITPVIHPREAFELMEHSFDWDKDLSIDYMFDSHHYFNTLAEDCPQLRFVDENDSTLNIPPKNESHVVSPKKLIPTKLGHVLVEPAKWRPALDEWIEKEIVQKHGITPTKESPVRLSFDDGIYFSWPTAYDGEDFRAAWGHLARYPRHIRELSARALYNLYRKIGCEQDPDAPSTGCFLGAHIRTEGDAAVEGWTSYATQLEHAREQLSANNLRVLYVATGTASVVEKLRADVANMEIPLNDTHSTGVEVIQKWDLLDEEDIQLMDTLTWDQMALVDLDIMLRSSRFVGIWESSWTWTIALKRGAWSKLDPYDYDSHPLTYEDEYSIIYGPVRAQAIIDPCLWL